MGHNGGNLCRGNYYDITNPYIVFITAETDL